MLLLRPLLAFVLLTLAAPDAHAQVRASERGWVGQRVDGTNITIEYGRPTARGRTLFGEVVHNGETWTPGANWATTFEADRDVTIQGHVVEAGAYSVWMVPTEGDEWTLHLHAEPGRFHTRRPDPDDMAVSVPVTRESGDYHEALTFHFPEVRRDGTTLHFHWGDTQVALEIGVYPSATGTLSPEEIEPFLGLYDMEMFGEGAEPVPFVAEVIDANGKMRAIVDDGEFAFELVPDAEQENTFYFGFLQNGQVVDIEEGPIHFNYEDGSVVGFTVLGIGIDIWMEAVKR